MSSIQGPIMRQQAPGHRYIKASHLSGAERLWLWLFLPLFIVLDVCSCCVIFILYVSLWCLSLQQVTSKALAQGSPELMLSRPSQESISHVHQPSSLYICLFTVLPSCAYLCYIMKHLRKRHTFLKAELYECGYFSLQKNVQLVNYTVYPSIVLQYGGNLWPWWCKNVNKS